MANNKETIMKSLPKALDLPPPRSLWSLFDFFMKKLSKSTFMRFPQGAPVSRPPQNKQHPIIITTNPPGRGRSVKQTFGKMLEGWTAPAYSGEAKALISGGSYSGEGKSTFSCGDFNLD